MLMAKGQRVGYVRVSTVDQNTERVVIGSSLGVEAARVELEVRRAAAAAVDLEQAP